MPENNYLCIDSSDPSNPTQFTQNTPWIFTNPSLGTTVKYLNGDINRDGYEDFIQIFSNNGNLGLKTYVNKNSVYSQSSTIMNLGMTQAGTIKFLTGDFNGDVKTDIVRVWDNNGKVALDYLMSNDTGFTKTARVSDLTYSKDAIDYVAVDANGDGKDDVVHVMNNNGKLECRLYFSDGTSISSIGDLTNTYLSGNAIRIMTGDFDGDGNKDIIKLWDNGGRLAIDCIKMVQYGTVSNPNMGDGSSAEDYLVGDVNGDYKADIIQLWNNNGRLAMINYLSKGDGYFNKAWANGNMGQGPGAVRFLTAKVNDDNKTDIVQIFDGGGKLGVINYLSNGTGYDCVWGIGDIDGGALSSTDYQAAGFVYDESKSSIIQVKETSQGNIFKVYFSDGYKFFADVTAPKALSIKASPTVIGSKIYANAVGVTDTCGVKKVLFATWTSNAGQDDLIWHEGSYFGRDNWSVVINRFEHKNEIGEYIIHAYGVDNYGNMGYMGAVTVNVLADTEGPTAYGITNSGSPTTNSYFKVTVNGVDDPSGVTRVSFPTWTNHNGQDDLIWHEGVYVGNSTWEFTVNKADHKSEKGEYITHVYAWDNEGNYRCLGEARVTLN